MLDYYYEWGKINDKSIILNFWRIISNFNRHSNLWIST